MMQTSISEQTICQHISQASSKYDKLVYARTQEFSKIDDLKDLTISLHQSLDRLFAFPVPVWNICVSLIISHKVEHAFVISMVAFRSLDVSKIRSAVEFCLKLESGKSILIHSLLSMPDYLQKPWIERFFRSKDFDHKFIALEVARKREYQITNFLESIFSHSSISSQEQMLALAFRVVGEQKIDRFSSLFKDHNPSKNSPLKFWIVWSSVLLGVSDSLSDLESFVVAPGPYQIKSADIFFRVASVDARYRMITKMQQEPGNTRTLIYVAKILGDSKAVPWLIDLMNKHEYAQLAAHSFEVITGIDLKSKGLTLELPQITAINLTTEKNQLKCPKSQLLWPDADKIRIVWSQCSSRYPVGKRHYYGAGFDVKKLQEDLTGLRRLGERKSAAIELALIQASQPLRNVSSNFY